MILCAGMALLQAAPSSTHRQSPPPAITFTDATQAAGLWAWRHVSGDPDKRYLIDSTGSGVAFWDFDDDGRLDIYLVNGSTLDHVRRGTAAPAAGLFRNAGNGTFENVTARAGVANGRWGQGVCAGDVDNDGRQDMYVTNYGINRLYRQTADGTFRDVAGAAGVAVEGWSTGCAFGDFDRDGWLDLYVAGYVALDPNRLPPAPGAAKPTPTAAATPTGAAPTPAAADGRLGLGASFSAGAASCTYRSEPVMCGPGGLPGAADHLFRNNGDGTFREVTKAAGVEDERRRYGFGVAWFDMDDDGWLDLLVANDSGPNHVYRNLGGGRFEDVSYLSGAALDGNGRSQAHMGIAIGDYDNDGRDDIHITNFADDFNVLYRNHDGTTFSDVSYAAGVAQPSIPFLGWGTEFIDYDNDGWKDLLVVNGHVYPQADRLPWNTSYAQRALLFRNLRGTRFEEVGRAHGRGALDASGFTGRSRRRCRQRRRHRHRRQPSRRSSDTGRQRRRGSRGSLAHDQAAWRPDAEDAARCDRIHGVRHRGRHAPARRSGEWAGPDLAVRPARARGAWRRESGRDGGGALVEWRDGPLSRDAGGRDSHHQPEDRRGDVRPLVTADLQRPPVVSARHRRARAQIGAVLVTFEKGIRRNLSKRCSSRATRRHQDDRNSLTWSIARFNERPRRCRSPQTSPTAAIRSGMLRSVNEPGLTVPRSSSSHVHGAETGAPRFARIV